MNQLSSRLQKLASPEGKAQLRGIRHGIEKEGLRVDPRGRLAHSPHQSGLGSALTNPRITTDYSEALLEFITPVFTDLAAALDYLEDLHRFTYPHIGDETIWAASMPGYLSGSEDVPIAEYGYSNVGRLKHIYRVGLEYRYGRVMQTIAGIHYNFSLPEAFWPLYRELEEAPQGLQSFRSASYFTLIRNFRRYSWLLFYLFGASPALSRSFLQGPDPQLSALGDHSLYAPWATCLRMSDLGYSNKAQSLLNICYNTLGSYLQSLEHAIRTPYPPYEEIGVKVNGRYRQLNTHILQIENEYYSDIRPKRVMRSGQRPIHALEEAGVEYVEIRSLDINPFLPVGIDQEQGRFLDTFLLFCLLTGGEPIGDRECDRVKANHALVVRRGREPGLMLESPQGPRTLTDWGRELLETLRPVAELLDSAQGGHRHVESLRAQQLKFEHPELTPSAQILDHLLRSGDSHEAFVLAQSKRHQQQLCEAGISAERAQELTLLARDSLAQQQALELADGPDFDTFLAEFLAS